VLAALTPTTTVTVGRTSKVAGRSTYDLRLVPRDPASLVGAVDLYVDARTGLALRTVVTPRGSTDPAVDIGFTSLRLTAPAASTFRFTPPAGATVRDVTVPEPAPQDHVRGELRRSDHSDPRVIGAGWTAVVESPALPQAMAGRTRGEGPNVVGALLRAAQPVHGAFGTGRLLRTRLLSVLQTADGRVFAGAVTPAELLRVAGSAASNASR
jgi:hypothetical protein